MKINLSVPINNLGYGVVSTNIAQHLHTLGHQVNLLPMGQVQLDQSFDQKAFQQMLANGQFFDYDAPCVKIWHQFDLSLKVGNGPYFVYPFFELDTLTDRERHHLNFADGIIVASKWAKQVLLNNGITKPIYVVRPGVNVKQFYPNPLHKKRFTSQNTYRFINIGKWEARKGHDVLCDMFNRAFTQEDDVELWLMPNNPFLTPQEVNQWKRQYLNSKLGNQIKFVSPVQNHEEVADIINSCDCGIFPSRAEAWNLEALETIACGKPTIITNYSGHTEFCNNENALLVDTPDREIANDGRWFFGAGSWAKITDEVTNNFIEHMRYCYKNRPENKGFKKTVEEFSWENTAKELVSLLTNHSDGV
jgi:glycosyltransferase involved in cell wall biosynthesis